MWRHIDDLVLTLVISLILVGLSEKFKHELHMILINVARRELLVQVENLATRWLPLVFVDAWHPRPFSLAQYVLNLSYHKT